MLNNFNNSDKTYYIDSFKYMFEKLETSYNSKSSRMLEYFVKNNLRRFNTETGNKRLYI